MLNAERAPGPGGRSWKFGAVSRLLRNERLTGKQIYGSGGMNDGQAPGRKSRGHGRARNGGSWTVPTCASSPTSSGLRPGRARNR
jgi:hypothetical protein